MINILNSDIQDTKEIRTILTGRFLVIQFYLFLILHILYKNLLLVMDN